MQYFKPQKGIKPIIKTNAFVLIFLIPSMFILISAQISIWYWILFFAFSFGLITIAELIAQKTTLYWIDQNNLHFKSMFLKGSIPIDSIKKLEANATCWLANMPKTSFNKGIYIYYGKYQDLFITPENPTLFCKELVTINPNIEVRDIK